MNSIENRRERKKTQNVDKILNIFARIIEGTLKSETHIDVMRLKIPRLSVSRYEIFLKIPLDLPSRKLNHYKKKHFSQIY